jgi:hypothetical protein
VSLYYVECHYAEGSCAEFFGSECHLAKFHYVILIVIMLSFAALSVILLSVMIYVDWSYAEFCCPGCLFVPLCYFVPHIIVLKVIIFYRVSVC